jgi:hypothetical protein
MRNPKQFVTGEDLGELLQTQPENAYYEAISPHGERLVIETREGQSVVSIRSTGTQPKQASAKAASSQLWRLRQIAVVQSQSEAF